MATDSRETTSPLRSALSALQLPLNPAWTLGKLSGEVLLRTLLALYAIRQVGWLNGAVLLEHTAARAGWTNLIWLCGDNGGELTLEPVNLMSAAGHALAWARPEHAMLQTYSGIPATCFGSPLSHGTLAYRVAMRMNGEAIDFDYVMLDREVLPTFGLYEVEVDELCAFEVDVWGRYRKEQGE